MTGTNHIDGEEPEVEVVDWYVDTDDETEQLAAAEAAIEDLDQEETEAIPTPQA